jgi:thiazole synthase
MNMEDLLHIGGRSIKSRLLIGTGKFAGYPLMQKALEAAQPDIVTVALRRVDAGSKADNILEYIPKSCILMANTSGARNADEAVRIARLAKASGAGNWIKIEVVQDNKYLLPDNLETLKAVEILSKEKFIVLPYMSPDLSMAKRMADAGAAAVMPLGSPIGSNRGVKTRELVEILVREIKVPVIVDAGLGSPSDACECMEMGCAAVLVNTAIAIAKDPVAMARAFKEAVSAGRTAYLAGLASSGSEASASSPLTGFLRDEIR